MSSVTQVFNRPVKQSKILYQEVLKREIMSYFKLNIMNVPELSHIVISISPGLSMGDKKISEMIKVNLAKIAAQQPIVCKAKKSVSSFKIREGMSVGAKVTLRNNKMYAFLDKLVYLALPRIKDFNGLKPSALDDNFNYNIGIKDYTIFREVDVISATNIYGLNITFALKNVQSKEQALYLLRSLGLPIIQ
jgi:large subunit ribosomal protein L5